MLCFFHKNQLFEKFILNWRLIALHVVLDSAVQIESVTGIHICPPSWTSLPNPGIQPRSPALQANSLPAERPEKPTLWITFPI